MNSLNRYYSTFTAKTLEQLLFFFCVLFIPTQIGKHFWPDFASIFSIETDYFSPVIYGWDILVVLLIIVFFYQGKKLRATSLFLFLFFLLTQLFSLAHSSNFGASLVRLEQYFIVGLFGVYIASQKFQTIKKQLYFGLVISVFFSGIIAILQVMQGRTLGLWFLGERTFSLDTISIATFDWYGQVFLRAYATFPHPNVLAAFFLISIGLIIWLHEQKVRLKHVEFEWLLFIVGSLGILLTFSRVALVFFGFVFGYLLKNRIKLFGLIFLLFLPFLYVRFNSAFNFDQLSFIRREELAIQSLEMIEKSPILGVGLNNFIQELAYATPVSGEIRFMQPVHNIFLLNLVETGIVGSVGFCLLLLVPIYKLIKKQSKLVLFLWISILGLGFFDHYFLTIAQGQRLLFLVWGISMLEYDDERSA